MDTLDVQRANLIIIHLIWTECIRNRASDLWATLNMQKSTYYTYIKDRKISNHDVKLISEYFGLEDSYITGKKLLEVDGFSFDDWPDFGLSETKFKLVLSKRLEEILKYNMLDKPEDADTDLKRLMFSIKSRDNSFTLAKMQMDKIGVDVVEKALSLYSAEVSNYLEHLEKHYHDIKSIQRYHELITAKKKDIKHQ